MSALLCATWALWLLVRHAARPVSGATFAAGVLARLAFLSTQKAIYFDLALGAGLMVNAGLMVGLRAAISLGAVLAGGWVLAVRCSA